MANSKADKELLQQFNITQTLQIQLTRLNVYTYSKTRTNLYKCHLCKYSSRFKGNVKIHLRSHTGEKPFSCNLCNYKCAQRYRLNLHILTHTGEKHYNCVFCKKSFTTNWGRAVHRNICKLNPGQSDPSWAEMQKPFKCKLCLHSTVTKSKLKRHMMSHTEEKPFPCTLCNKKFSLQQNLKVHIFTHTREKAHNCQYCKTGFAGPANQKSHEKTCKLNPKQGDAKWVEEQKKFKCHLCNYRTRIKSDLERHLKLHSGEKPFKCPLCVYKSSFNTSLHRHVRHRHARENGSKCPECDFTTNSMSSKLLNHVIKAHVENFIS